MVWESMSKIQCLWPERFPCNGFGHFSPCDFVSHTMCCNDFEPLKGNRLLNHSGPQPVKQDVSRLSTAEFNAHMIQFLCKSSPKANSSTGGVPGMVGETEALWRFVHFWLVSLCESLDGFIAYVGVNTLGFEGFLVVGGKDVIELEWQPFEQKQFLFLEGKLPTPKWVYEPMLRSLCLAWVC